MAAVVSKSVDIERDNRKRFVPALSKRVRAVLQGHRVRKDNLPHSVVLDFHGGAVFAVESVQPHNDQFCIIKAETHRLVLSKVLQRLPALPIHVLGQVHAICLFHSGVGLHVAVCGIPQHSQILQHLEQCRVHCDVRAVRAVPGSGVCVLVEDREHDERKHV